MKKTPRAHQHGFEQQSAPQCPRPPFPRGTAADLRWQRPPGGQAPQGVKETRYNASRGKVSKSLGKEGHNSVIMNLDFMHLIKQYVNVNYVIAFVVTLVVFRNLFKGYLKTN